MSPELPPGLLSERGFGALGLDFPLFQAPIAQAREYAGLGRCDLCYRRDLPCFSLEGGAELLVECAACTEELALDVGDRAGRGCPRCGEAVAFPLAPAGRLRACAICLQAGLVALGKRTELGELHWEGALGTPRGRLELLELLRTPGFDSWSGRGIWLLCCDRPMIYRGCWGPEDFAALGQPGGGEGAFIDAVQGGGAAGWAALGSGLIEVHAFRCAACGRHRASAEDRDRRAHRE